MKNVIKLYINRYALVLTHAHLYKESCTYAHMHTIEGSDLKKLPKIMFDREKYVLINICE